MEGMLALIVLAALPIDPKIAVVAGLVIAVVILIAALMLFRSSGKKKAAKQQGASGAADWQRSQQQGVPGAGAWNGQGMGATADACAWQSKSKCLVVIPRNGPVSDLRAYRRHEVAHCNGWSHSHGGAANSEGDSDLGNVDRMR